MKDKGNFGVNASPTPPTVQVGPQPKVWSLNFAVNGLPHPTHPQGPLPISDSIKLPKHHKVCNIIA